MAERNQRLIVVDDEKEIVQAYKDFLMPAAAPARRSSRVAAAGPAAGAPAAEYEILSAYSGADAIALVKAELEQGRRIAGGFFDVKMEGGVDGLQAIQEIWKLDPELHCTVVTAYQDRTVDDISQLFGDRFKDQWDYLNKPFTQAEIVQKARQMIASWNRKRSLEQAHRQLVHSERLAAVGQLARAIGHDFSNLLTAIIGKADLALHDADPAKVKEKLKLILQAGERASILARNLQSFGRPSAAKPAQPIQLADAIRNTLSLVGHDLVKAKVTLADRSSPTAPVLGALDELEQVFMNLVINAKHAMPEGGALEVGCADEGASVIAWVRDTGTGIPPEVLPRIFEYAFTTKGDQGSGLGLAISRDIVEKFQGALEVSTEVGKGTCFTLRFPGVK